jgi:uncharacterized protein YdaU (DUF1376 family)
MSTPSNSTKLWVPIYIADYLADTSRLTTEQHGAYLLLIFDYWRNGPLPDDDAVLAQVCRLSSDAWSMHSAMLRGFFTKAGDGLLHQKRIDAEITKAQLNRAVSVTRAKKAAEARWGKDAPINAPSIPQAMLDQCPSPSPSPIETNTAKADGADAPEREIVYGDEFAQAPPPKPTLVKSAKSLTYDDVEKIRLAYPRKVSQEPARKAIRAHHALLVSGKVVRVDGTPLPKMKPQEATAFLLEQATLYAASAEGQGDQQYIAHPASWFNAKRYAEDPRTWNHSQSGRQGNAMMQPPRRSLLDKIDEQRRAIQ